MPIDKKLFALIQQKQKELYDGINDRLDSLYPFGLDGTKANYDRLMKQWFLSHGVFALSPKGLTTLVDSWYAITRSGWDGGTRFYQPSVSSSSSGEKIGDNAGLRCTPSTNKIANVDDYAGLPLFAVKDCNYIVDPDTLEPVITAIDGITDNFVRNDPEIFVGVLQMTGFHWYEEDDQTYTHGYSDSWGDHPNIAPLPEAVRVDGTVRPWVVHSKYMSKTVNGKLTSCAGLIPTAYSISHNSLHTLSKAIGSQYSGGCMCDNDFIRLMAFLKYGSMTLDGILQGCLSYNYQYTVAVGEENTTRLIMTTENGSKFKAGSSVLIGVKGSFTDRGQSYNYSISGNGGVRILSVEDVTIDGTVYKALNLDCDPITTTADSTYVSTWHWASGSCDAVLGNDGSPDSPGSGEYPAKIQGIEYSVGGYEVYADIILNLYQDSEDSKYYYEPMIVNRSAKQATSVTADYKSPGIRCAQPASNSWQYIRKLGYSKGVLFPVDCVGGSSSTFTRDGFYMNGNTTGTREYLAFGDLNFGTGHGGVSHLNGHNDLSNAYWTILARLSPNGNRGEFAA